jgi:tungstate transport system substrate-binding protein
VFPYERGLWAQAGRDPAAGGASWYREAPPGKPLLEVASEARAYALVERAIWLAFADRRSLDLLVQGDPGLRVSYQVLVASSLKHPGVRSVEGERLADWLTSVAGRAAIESFRLRGAPVYSTPAP